MAPPRQERSEESTRRLLDAAAELIAETGYTGTTLAAVGARAGYSRSLVTSRFGSKDNLVAALLDRLTAAWAPHFTRPPAAPDGLQSLIGLVQAVGDGVRADRTGLMVLQRLIFDASSRSATELHEWFQKATVRIQHDVATVVRVGIDDGSIRADVVPEDEARLLIAALRGISYEWFLYPELIDMAGLHRTLGDHIRRSLAATPVRKGRRS